MDGEERTRQGQAHELMSQAFEILGKVEENTRAGSLAKTKLEEAIMWNNKDRAVRGELEKSDTFVG